MLKAIIYPCLLAAVSGALITAGLFALAEFLRVSNMVDIAKIAEESEVIESLAVYALALAGGIGFALFLKYRQKPAALFSLWMLLCALREIDAHKAVTHDSFLKSRFYSAAETPLFEKAFGLFIIILLIILVFQTGKALWDARKTIAFNASESFCVILGGGLIILAKILDAFVRLFPSLIDFAKEWKDQFRFTEESLETLGFTLFLLAILIVAKKLVSQSQLAQ